MKELQSYNFLEIEISDEVLLKAFKQIRKSLKAERRIFLCNSILNYCFDELTNKDEKLKYEIKTCTLNEFPNFYFSEIASKHPNLLEIYSEIRELLQGHIVFEGICEDKSMGSKEATIHRLNFCKRWIKRLEERIKQKEQT